MQGLGQEAMLSLHAELGAGSLARSHPTCSCASCWEALGGLRGGDALLFVVPAFPIHRANEPGCCPQRGAEQVALEAGSGCHRRRELQRAGKRELHRKEGKLQDLGSGEGAGESKPRRRKVDEGRQASCWERPDMLTMRSNLPLSHTGSFLIKSLQKPSLQSARRCQRAACAPTASVQPPDKRARGVTCFHVPQSLFLAPSSKRFCLFSGRSERSATSRTWSLSAKYTTHQLP